MAHQLSTYDANGKHVSTRSFEDRGEAFAAYDRAVRSPGTLAALIRLSGDGVSREHRFDGVEPPEHPDEAPEAPQAGGDDRERAGDAHADAGDAAHAREAAPQAEAASGARKPASGRASLGPLTAAPRDATKKGR